MILRLTRPAVLSAALLLLGARESLIAAAPVADTTPGWSAFSDEDKTQQLEAAELAKLSREASEASRALSGSLDSTERTLIIGFAALVVGIVAYWLFPRQRDRRRTALAEKMRMQRESAATAALDRYLGDGGPQSPGGPEPNRPGPST